MGRSYLDSNLLVVSPKSCDDLALSPEKNLFPFLDGIEKRLIRSAGDLELRNRGVFRRKGRVPCGETLFTLDVVPEPLYPRNDAA